MRTIETNVYKFEELSEQGKDNAVERLSDINTSHTWYEFTYDDANNVGIKIEGFDIDRGAYVKLEIDSHIETAQKILAEHGETCDTYKDAKQFIEDIDKLVEEDENEEFCEQKEELEDNFKKALEEDYLSMLRNEYEYLNSREAIIETIEANEYEFTEDGKLI
jgi:predicted RNA-binding protein YlxR (DUF448 family)